MTAAVNMTVQHFPIVPALVTSRAAAILSAVYAEHLSLPVNAANSHIPACAMQQQSKQSVQLCMLEGTNQTVSDMTVNILWDAMLSAKVTRILLKFAMA